MKRILWIGNSFTYVNDLPKIFETLARSEGKDVYCNSVTKGGWYLHRHADPTDEVGAKVAEVLKEKWDVVILQEQSYHPIRDHMDYVASARSIMEKCGKASIYLYQTWSYEKDSQKLKNTGLSFETMHHALRDSIRAAANELDVGIVPVGDALYQAVTKHERLKMYCEDSYHPSLMLSYLAALKFYKAIYGESATCYIPEEISKEDAAILQNIGETE